MSKFSRDPDAIARLSPEQYRVTQKSGTEAPGTGEYLDNKEPGIYVDIVSGEPLFASSDKFESGCGWPSFTKPIDPEYVNELNDSSHASPRAQARDNFVANVCLAINLPLLQIPAQRSYSIAEIRARLQPFTGTPDTALAAGTAPS